MGNALSRLFYMKSADWAIGWAGLGGMGLAGSDGVRPSRTGVKWKGLVSLGWAANLAVSAGPG